MCRVCGYDSGDVRWDGQDCPTYDICDCCGTESGYEDTLVTAVRKHRQRWLDEGMPWWRSAAPPPGWQPSGQLKGIPEKWR